MHEISIAGAIIDAVLQSAEKNRAVQVKKVHLQVGELTSLNPDQLKFIFQTITKGTILEEAEFRIEIIKPLIECRKCGYCGPIEYFEKLHLLLPTIKCPKCQETEIEILQGRECNIKSITIK